MKLLQLIYTSARNGLSGGPGFQTYSMSEGISQEEQREIERYGLYIPPPHLPSQPNKQEIEELFPTALRFFRLKSGRYAVCQSRYVGQDYSRRYGNYFSHTLVLEKGQFPIYPIQFYGFPLFRDHLTDEENNSESEPGPLPPLAVDPDQLLASTVIQFDNIVQFVEHKGIETLKQMVNAVVSRAQTHRNLILCDSQENIPQWTAALQMSFNLKLAHYLTFTTYIHDPAAMSSVISAIPNTGSRPDFSEVQRNFDYYIFDFQTQEIPAIEEEYQFTDKIDAGFTFGKNYLDEFHHFVDLFDFDCIDKRLDTVDDLYRFLKFENQELSAQRITAALEFAKGNASTEVLGKLSDSLERIIEPVSQHVDFKSAKIVTEFLFRVAAQTRHPKHLDTAYGFFFQSLDYLVAKTPGVSLEPVETFYNGTRQLNHTREEEFFKRSLDSGRLLHINDNISASQNPICAEIYFILLISTFISAHYTWERIAKNNDRFEPLIKAIFKILVLSDSHFTKALEAAGQDRKLFVKLLSFLLKQVAIDDNEDEILLHTFINAAAKYDIKWLTLTRLDLINLENSDFVFREYIFRLKQTPKKSEFFRDYFQSIFEQNIHFARDYFSNAVESYLELLPEKEYFPECRKIIEHEKYIADDAVIKKVVQGVESGLKLEFPGKELHAEILTLSKIKLDRKIITSPDITELILSGIQFEKAAAGLEEIKLSKSIKTPSLNLAGLTEKQVSRYFEWSLPSVLRLVKNPGDHRVIFEWYWNSSLYRKFAREYISAISHIIKEDKEQGLDILLNFSKFYLSSIFQDKAYQTVRETIRDELVKVLLKLSESRFSQVRRKMVHSKFTNEKVAEREWRNIAQMVETNREPSIFSIVKDKLWKKSKAVKKNKKTKKRK